MMDTANMSTTVSNTKLTSSSTSETLSNSEASQTQKHPDLPYLVPSTLPPIFNSELRFRINPIMFVSKSLPSLDTICWASPSDSEDEIDELLSDQYDHKWISTQWSNGASKKRCSSPTTMNREIFILCDLRDLCITAY